MANNTLNLQDAFLNQARKLHIPLTVFLTNGFQFKGYVKGFDSFIVVLESDGHQNMVYKHAISTISPMRYVGIFSDDCADEEPGTIREPLYAKQSC